MNGKRTKILIVFLSVSKVLLMTIEAPLIQMSLTILSTSPLDNQEHYNEYSFYFPKETALEALKLCCVAIGMDGAMQLKSC